MEMKEGLVMIDRCRSKIPETFFSFVHSESKAGVDGHYTLLYVSFVPHTLRLSITHDI